MAYTPTQWVNGQPPALNAENLNKMEAGIAEINNIESNYIGERERVTINIFDPAYVEATTSYIHRITGEVISDPNGKASDYIETKPGDVFILTGAAQYSTCGYAFFTEDKTLISTGCYNKTTPGDLYVFNDERVETPENAKYIRIGTYFTTIYGYGVKLETYQSIAEEIEKIKESTTSEYVGKTLVTSENLIDQATMVQGYITNGRLVSNASYRTTDYLPVETGTAYARHTAGSGLGSQALRVHLYSQKNEDSYVGLITGTELGTTATDWSTFTVSRPDARYMRICHTVTAGFQVYLGIGEEIVNPIPEYFEPYYISEDNVKIRKTQIEDYNDELFRDPLYGKVWYSIGDSATHGDFNGIVQPNIDHGIYAGQLPVYPFFIGNRTGMIVHNVAVNGSVIATIPDQPTRYQWSKDGVYDTIVGQDADYITIWLGANDMWQSVPIGTIDSTDATTFYGAWNKLLDYYSRNYPKAKLGAVASFWCSEAYVTAVKNVAKKYGVPVLNLYDDPSVPVTVGSQRPDVSATVKAYRDAQWRVSTGNAHPSAEYHEIESYFIESWLKTL